VLGHMPEGCSVVRSVLHVKSRLACSRSQSRTVSAFVHHARLWLAESGDLSLGNPYWVTMHSGEVG
jgi:hypothetical protein